MTPRERVWLSIKHQPTDFVPYHIIYTIPVKQRLEQHFQSTNLDEVIGNHIVKYRLRPPDVQISPNHWQDGYGVIWDRSLDPDIGVVTNYQLTKRDLSLVKFLNPHDNQIYAGLPDFINKNKDRFRMASIGFALFERAWSLRNMEELLVDMIEAPSFVHQLFEKITDIQLQILDHALQFDIDAILFGDDWGQQSGLIFGAKLWKKFIKPYIAKMYAKVKQANKAVFIHTCGKVQELFPELIECGVDVFNPFQPEVMDVYEVKKQFGNQLSFYGGVSIQNTLPFGSPPAVKQEVKKLLQQVGKNGGYIIAPSHAMPNDIPIENILAFIETVQEQQIPL